MYHTFSKTNCRNGTVRPWRLAREALDERWTAIEKEAAARDEAEQATERARASRAAADDAVRVNLEAVAAMEEAEAAFNAIAAAAAVRVLTCYVVRAVEIANAVSCLPSQ